MFEPVTFLVGFVAVGAGAWWAWRRSTRKQRALGGPVLTISTTPYAFGEAVPCRVASTVRSPIRVERVRFQLSCFEVARWTEVERRGGKTRRVQHSQTAEVWSAEAVTAVGRELRAGERFEAEADLKLPEDAGGPTFDAAHNQVGWQVSFAVDDGEGTIAVGAVPLILEARRRFTGPGARR